MVSNRLLLIGLALLPGWVAPAAPESERWTDDDSMLAFFQAAREISARSLETNSVEDITWAAMNAYLRETDPYARYLRPEEYKMVREAAQETYGGVGMEIFQEGEGSILCLPYPDSPAEMSGIREGDALVSIDGAPVPAAENILLTGARIRGPVGSGVRLGIRRPDYTENQLLLFRDRVRARTLLVAGINTFRILAFEQGTVQELRIAVSKADPRTPVVLDLRGNPGGSLGAAIECARLFLKKDMTVVEVRTRAGTTRHAGREDGPFMDGPPLVLWQDRRTASSAEVFTAALTGNGRARSIGVTTYGKGVTQRTSELLNGAALLLTDGRLVPPGGLEYDGKGLPPGVEVEGPGDAAYRAATDRIPSAPESLSPRPDPAP